MSEDRRNSDDGILWRLDRLEDSEKQLYGSLQELTINVSRMSVSMEVLAESMAHQTEMNVKQQRLSERIGTMETHMDIIKKIGWAIISTGIVMGMYFLFGKGAV